MAKILVAEDEQDIRELVVDTLFDLGSDVFEAGPFQNDSGPVFRGVLPAGPGPYLPDESPGLLSRGICGLGLTGVVLGYFRLLISLMFLSP